MSLNSPKTSQEFSEPVRDTLTKAQKAVVDRVTLILDTNPELNKKVSESFKKNFLEVVNNSDKFNLLLEKLGGIELEKLGNIEKRFQKKELTQELAIEESKAVIEHYTKAKLTALKGQLNAPEEA